jgi:hypothetical protein
LRIHKVAPIPVHLSILIGDCVFNLRSGLDHLALALADKFTPNMSNERIRDSEFPIFDNPRTYAKQWPKKIGCVAPAARAVIELLQPYHRGKDYFEHPLWQVHTLNILDKHRRLTVCASAPRTDFTWQVKKVNVADLAYVIPADLKLDLRKAELDAIFMRWAGRPIVSNQDMRMDLVPPFEPALDERHLAGKMVVPLLKALCDFVGDSVMAPLSKFL